MTELSDRLARLADAAVADHRLTDPSATVAVDGRRPGPPRRWLAAAVVLVALAVVAGVAVRNDDRTGPVTAGPDTTEPPSEPSATAPLGDPVLSVAFQLVGGDAPLGLQVVVRDADGATVAERTSAEVEEPEPDGSPRVIVRRGLVVDLPAPGTYTVDLVGDGATVTCDVGPVGPGERIVVPVAIDEVRPRCEPAEPVEAWAGPSGEVGQHYVGLPEDEAVARATADGHRAEVPGRDGVLLPTTRMGLALWVFDGVVVSASLAAEPPAADLPRTDEPLAVVVSSFGQPVAAGGEVVVRVGDQVVTRPWSTDLGGGGPHASALFGGLPTGPAEVMVTGDVTCTQGVELHAEGTVATFVLEATEGGRVACEGMVETLEEHLARVTDGLDRYEPAEAYLGLTASEAWAQAEADGFEVRVLARDGLPFGRDDDLRIRRVNLVLYDDEVRAAAVF